MTSAVIDKSIATYQTNAAPAAASVQVRATATWDGLRPASPFTEKPSFDARAAGRRAVRRHGEALRRLAD